MEKETQTFTNIPECLVQAALCKEERAQEILIFLGRAYFVPSKNWVKKKIQVTSPCLSLASQTLRSFSCSLLQHYCISSVL